MIRTTGSAYLRFFLRWLPLLVLGPILGGGAGYLVVRSIPSVYQATVTLLVQPADAAANGGAQDLQAAQDLAQTYAEAIHTRRILSQAAAQVGLANVSERDIEGRVQARRVPATELLRVTADDTNPERAADLANAVAQVFVKQNADFQASRYASSRDNLAQLVSQMQSDIDARSAVIANVQAQPASPERDAQVAQLQNDLAQIRTTYSNTVKSYEDLRVTEARSTNTVTIFDPAVTPEDPIRPNRSLTVLLAALAGLLAAVGIAVVADFADDGLRDAREIAAATGLMTLGLVPNGRVPGGRDSAVAPSSESYRVLGTRVLFAMHTAAARSIMIASAASGEGKSTVAANLARVLADGGQQVILVDADVHRPTQMQLFGLPNEPGLSNVLVQDRWSLAKVLHVTPQPNLRVLAAGPMPAEPASVFGSSRLHDLFDELGRLCDVLIIDSPSLLAQPDGLLMAPYIDSVAFIVDARKTRGRQATRALEMLRSAGAEVLGAVVNRAGNESLDYVPSAGSNNVSASVATLLAGEDASLSDGARGETASRH